MDTAQQLDLATRVARRLTRDPEALSIAGEAVLHAQRTWDPAGGTSQRQWIALTVRSRVGSYARTRACRPLELVDPALMAHPTEERPEVAPLDTDDEPSEYDPDEFRLLAEKYIDRRPDWSLARQYGCTEHQIRKRVAAATARFLRYMGA